MDGTVEFSCLILTYLHLLEGIYKHIYLCMCVCVFCYDVTG